MRGLNPFGLLALSLVFVFSACSNNKAAIDRVGVNAVKKSFFEDSSWYFSRTVIDVDYEGPSLAFNLEEEQLGFQVLRRLVDLQEKVGTLASGPERDLTMIELQQGESFLEYLIDLQAAYGISNVFVD